MKRPLLPFLAALVLVSHTIFAQQTVLLQNAAIVPASEQSNEVRADSVTSSPFMLVSLASPVVAEVSLEWKQWSVVENYAFGKDRGKMTMIADLNALHPYFRDKIKTLIANCRAKGIELAIVESFRTHAKQSEYMGMGKGYTSTGAGKSKHQYGLAIDVVPMVNNVAVWDNKALWMKIGVSGEQLGLRWGGRWKQPYDPAHFEWTNGLTALKLATGALPEVPKEEYPCIDEDVALLRQHWKEWENFQGLK